MAVNFDQVTVDVDLEIAAMEEENNKDYELERQIVVWKQDETLTTVHGMNIPANLPPEERLRALKLISKYIGGETYRIDKFLNRVIWVVAFMQHDVKLRIRDGEKPYIDPTTGERDTEFKPGVRTVLHIVAVDNKMLPQRTKISFTSVAVLRFFEEFVSPLFGIGELELPLPVVVERITAGSGFSYALSCPEDVEYPGKGGEK